MAKKKQEVKLKEPVRIRFKQLANGNQSIYLDYYTGDIIRKENYVGGKRQYEFLKLYLIPEKTREDKAKNEATLALAKAIQSKRIVELQNDAHGFQNTNKSKANVIDYLMNMRSQSKERGSLNYEKTIGNAIRELKLFRGDYIAFRDIDKDFLNSFVDFLKQAKKASKFGLLKAGAVAFNLQGDLLMLNKQVYTNISYSQQIQYIVAADEDDLIIIFSYTGAYFDYQDLRALKKRLTAPKIWMISSDDREYPECIDRTILFKSLQDQNSHPYQLQFIAGLIAQEYSRLHQLK